MLAATAIACVFLAIVVSWKPLSFVMLPRPDGNIVLKGAHIDANTLSFDAFCSGNIVARFDYRNLLDAARINKSDLVKPETNLARLYRFSGNRRVALKISWSKERVVITDRDTGQTLLSFEIDGVILNVDPPPSPSGDIGIGMNTSILPTIAVVQYQTHSEAGKTEQLPIIIVFSTDPNNVRYGF